MLDKIILGDNQFFGVNHMSQDIGKERFEQFKDIEEIRAVLHLAIEQNVRAVMFSTHPSIYKITEMIRSDKMLRENLSFYINVPYIMKYVQMVTESGMYETLKTALGGSTFIENSKFMLRSSLSALTGDYVGLITKLIDVEIKPFRGLKVKSVFLHNAITDLAMAYDLRKVIKRVFDHINQHYQVTPGFITLNYSKADSFLSSCGIENAYIMSSINKNGFLMNPSREASEETLRISNYPHIAMATLASGSLRPAEAYDYLFSLGKIDSVVVGASSQKHIEETFSLIQAKFELSQKNVK